MKFQEIQYHVEGYGCSVDHLIEEAYMVTNCINAHICQIEKLPFYSDVTLCHYFYELGVPAPEHLAVIFERYKDLRDNLIPAEIENEESEE